MATLTFFPAPSFASPVLTVSARSSDAAWAYLKADIAEYAECPLAALKVEDFVWDDGERFSDFILLDNVRLIGSLNEHLTTREWKHFYATRIEDLELRVRGSADDAYDPVEMTWRRPDGWQRQLESTRATAQMKL